MPCIFAARCVAQKYFPLRTPEDTSEKEEGCHIKLLLSDSLHYIIDFFLSQLYNVIENKCLVFYLGIQNLSSL